jgi:uncharacterized protein YgbK (DUF1537 family)
MIDAADIRQLPFVPAFPEMNRITSKGIHYIDGVPVSKSVFGKDPFEPVTRDSVKEIIHLQSELKVTEIPENTAPEETNEKSIMVFDVTSDTMMTERVQYLSEHNLCNATAGCAGLAAKLPAMLHLEGNHQYNAILAKKLLVICGSVNPITKKQLDYGEQCGYPRIRLTASEKLDKFFWDAKAGKDRLDSIRNLFRISECCMIDSNDIDNNQTTLQYAQEQSLTLEQVRKRISESMGRVAGELLGTFPDAVFMIIGGDTLLGFMKCLNVRELLPLYEISPGSVLTKLSYLGREHFVITKSGGFGEENLLEQLLLKLTQA